MTWKKSKIAEANKKIKGMTKNKENKRWKERTEWRHRVYNFLQNRKTTETQ